jgi:hypothetical protein
VVGRRGAKQDVVGQGLVEDGAAGAAKGRAPPVAADALVRQGAVQGPPRRQVPVEGKLAGEEDGVRGQSLNLSCGMDLTRLLRKLHIPHHCGKPSPSAAIGQVQQSSVSYWALMFLLYCSVK